MADVYIMLDIPDVRLNRSSEEAPLNGSWAESSIARSIRALDLSLDGTLLCSLIRLGAAKIDLSDFDRPLTLTEHGQVGRFAVETIELQSLPHPADVAPLIVYATSCN